MPMAFAKREMVTEDIYPACNEEVCKSLWNMYKFRVIAIIEDDESYNVILQHPLNGKEIKVDSYYLDFTGEQ